MLPITREEIYLYKLAGHTIETPEPITRKELYLAKACGESVEIPEPITREETYLYKLAGVDVEIPKPITTLERLMYAVCGGVIEIQPPVTHLEWFWYNILNTEKTISGIPPVAFISDGTTLSAWIIYGNGQQTGTPTPDNPIMPEFVGALSGSDWTIPITCAGQTTTVYLGQTQTVRRVKKLVLTGEETWILSTVWKKPATSVFYSPLADVIHMPAENAIFICSNAFAATTRNELYSGDSDMVARTGTEALTIRISDGIAATVADLKAYLAAQYAAGTPVCVWYVLATPETGIVNEPLAKIGDYADELHSEDVGVTIQTVSGTNTFDVNTTLKPSSVTITGHISQ